MASDASLPVRAGAGVHAGLRSRAAAIDTRLVLGTIVAASFGVRFLAALGHRTPRYFPDEYIYSSLARSLAASGTLAIRGEPAHFPALLQPLLTAPLWLFGDAQLAYRLTQGLNVLAMSLAAVPVYLVARRLALGPVPALGAGALAVAIPDLLFASYITADAIAYTLALAAFAAGVAALDDPTRRAQLAFVVFSALAVFARLQYLVLPLSFAAAALFVERGSLRRTARTFRLSLGLLIAPLPVAALLGASGLFSYYGGITGFDLSPGGIGHWLAVDLMLLAHASGWVLAPAAAIGLIAALLRPRTAAERAFGLLGGFLCAALLLEAGLYATNGSARFQERYLMTILPLIPLFFGVAMRRSGAIVLPVLAVSAGLLVVVVRVPLSGYTVGTGKQDSPFLFAISRLEQLLGTGEASLLIALAAGLCAAVAVAAAARPRVGGVIATSLALVATGAASVSASSGDRVVDRRTVATFLPADFRWVDHARLGQVSLLVTPYTPQGVALENLFWNRSLDNVLLMNKADVVDAFGFDLVKPAPDGRLLVGDRPITGPLLVTEYADTVSLSGATLVRRNLTTSLWKPTETPKLSLLAVGRYFDGWFAPGGRITVWPDAAGATRGRLRLVLSLPRGMRRLPPVVLSAPGLHRRVDVAPGRRRVVELDIDAQGPWTLHFRTSRLTFLADGRAISMHGEAPSFARTPPSRDSRTPRRVHRSS